MASAGHRFVPSHLSPFAFESLTISTSAVNVTRATALNAQAALVTVEDQAVTWREDGAAATDTVGHKAVATDAIVLGDAQAVGNLSMIRTGGTDATVRVTYYK